MPAAHVFENGDRIYLVSPVSPYEPGEQEIAHFAFAEDLKKAAPNPNLAWFRGNYVEADKPNLNGHEWREGELAIKSLTPMFCPVTVMHDPRTAVGLIADTSLRLPAKDNVPRAKIETALALWAHRFPDVVEEAMHNYEQGVLMQSMECMSPYYSCGACGETFHKLPGGAEEKHWCAHLAENRNASRILEGVTFTGTGLIFGSRGAKGAYTEANLETAIKEEIVAAHTELHTEKPTTTRPTAKPRSDRNIMEIDQAKYDELMARPTKEELAAANDRADKAEEGKREAEGKLETAETAQKKAEKERDDIVAEKETLEETARQSEMGGDRLAKLGKDFTARLGETTTERLREQAKTMSEEDWEARLVELESLTEVKRDAGTDATAAEQTKPGGGTVTREETASARLGGGSGGSGTEPSTPARSSVVGGLVKRVPAHSGATPTKD